MVEEVLVLVLWAIGLTLLLGPIVGVAFLALRRGYWVSVGLAVSIFAFYEVLLFPFLSISGGFATEIPFVPFYMGLFLIGTEWAIRERSKVVDFLRSGIGKASVSIGVAHAVVAILLQVHTRPDYIWEWEYLTPSVFFSIHFVENAIGIGLVFVFLSTVIVLPAFLWYHRDLLAPVAIITGWVVLAAWWNYLVWDWYPVSPIRGFGIPSISAPDYATTVWIPLLLILMAAIVEDILRGSNSKDTKGDTTE